MHHFIECICNINNTQIDHRKDIDAMMPMYNLIENSDNYSKISGSLLQYYKDEPNDNITWILHSLNHINSKLK